MHKMIRTRRQRRHGQKGAAGWGFRTTRARKKTPDCKPITTTDVHELKRLFREYAPLEGEFSDTRSIKIKEQAGMNPIGVGGFNRVFLDEDAVCGINESNKSKYIIRLAIKPHERPSQKNAGFLSRAKNALGIRNKYEETYKETDKSGKTETKTHVVTRRYNEEAKIYAHRLAQFIREISNGVVAANAGVGPQIYHFGSTAASSSTSEQLATFRLNKHYFYSVMQKIDGEMLSAVLKRTKDAKSLNLAKELIDDAIHKSDVLGDKGMLLYDTKPENVMADINSERPRTYIIDFDPKFTKFERNYAGLKFAKTSKNFLNSTLLLVHCIKILYEKHTANPNSHMKELIDHCVDKLKPMYYDHAKRYHLVTEIMLMDDELFRNIVSHYDLLYYLTRDFSDNWDKYKHARSRGEKMKIEAISSSSSSSPSNSKKYDKFKLNIDATPSLKFDDIYPVDSKYTSYAFE